MLLPLITIYSFWREKTRKKPLPSSSNPILQLLPEIDKKEYKMSVITTYIYNIQNKKQSLIVSD